MIRLYVIGEGETEEAIVNRVLVPHLSARNVFPIAQSQGGGGRWGRWRTFLQRLMKQERGDDVRFTTLFDLYKLPKDYPGSAVIRTVADTRRRADMLEQAMKTDLADPRLIPYVQRHEIEALVLAGLDELANRLPHARDGVEKLRRDLGGRHPEDVNEGPDTHPSKRLDRFVSGYGKLADGPAIVERVGLARVRAVCPRFDAWLTTLEALDGSAAL